ncbi:MAG: hypothetical protein ABIJ74_02605 [archaeon]
MKSSIKSDEIKIVLDTNIVVSALIAKQGASAKIFEKLLAGQIIKFQWQ